MWPLHSIWHPTAWVVSHDLNYVREGVKLKTYDKNSLCSLFKREGLEQKTVFGKNIVANAPQSHTWWPSVQLIPASDKLIHNRVLVGMRLTITLRLYPTDSNLQENLRIYINFESMTYHIFV